MKEQKLGGGFWLFGLEQNDRAPLFAFLACPVYKTPTWTQLLNNSSRFSSKAPGLVYDVMPDLLTI
jgi:hypothetical protein